MVGFSFFFTKFVSLRRNSEAPRPRAGPFDKAIRQVHGGESNRTAHGPEQVEGLPGKVYHFILCPFLPAGRQGPRLSRFGGTGHIPVNRRLAVTVHIKRPILSTLEFRLALFTPGIDGFVTIFGGMSDSLDRSCQL